VPAGRSRRTTRWTVRDRHLAEHPHDHDDQDAGNCIGEKGRRPDLADDRAGADEQAGTDYPTDRDHCEMALLEALFQAVVAWSVCHRPLHSNGRASGRRNRSALQADSSRSITAQAPA
jgi:hypothetical protein